MGKYVYAYGKKQGYSHVRENLPCQDYALCFIEDDAIVAVVSDGCGSSSISEIGSKITTEVLSRFLLDNFDTLIKNNGFDREKGNASLQTKKQVALTVVSPLLDYIKAHKEELEPHARIYEKSHPHEGNIESDDDYLRLLNATAVFYIEKNNLAIFGQLGDGALGLVEDGKMKIVLEERKVPGAENETFYPSTLYLKAKKEGDQWFKLCRMRLINSENIDGAFLTSDGVTACFEKPAPFQKRYNKSVGRLFKRIASYDNEEERNAYIDDEGLVELQKNSYEIIGDEDDVSLVAICKKDIEINEYVIKQYPRPDANKNNSEQIKEKKEEPQIEKTNPVKENPIDYNQLVDNYLLEAKKIYDDVERINFHNLISYVRDKRKELSYDKKYSFIVDKGIDEETIFKAYIVTLKALKEVNNDNELLEEELFKRITQETRIFKKFVKKVVEIILISDQKIIRALNANNNITYSR